MQPTIVRTNVQKRNPLHFLVDGLQVWVTYLDAKENGPFGVRFKWMEDRHACSPLQHITEDGGYSYQKFESFLMLDDNGGIDNRMTEQETDPEKLDRLQRIWVAYQQKLNEIVFSV